MTGDGRVVLFTTFRDAARGLDVWVWTAEGAKGGVPLVAREFHQTQAQLSRDGRRIAYVSNESGRNEVFVADVRIDPALGILSVGESLPISEGGGFAPRWSGDGRELFYLTIDGGVMTVEVDERTSSSGTPRKLFSVPGVMQEWGVTKDGSRFLFAVPVGPTPPLTIVRDWQAGLQNETPAQAYLRPIKAGNEGLVDQSSGLKQRFTRGHRSSVTVRKCQWVGTRRFSSSSQCCTKIICAGARFDGASLLRGSKNRWPSGATS